MANLKCWILTIDLNAILYSACSSGVKRFRDDLGMKESLQRYVGEKVRWEIN